MKFHNIQQGTDEWYNLKKGKFTASFIYDLFSQKSTLTYQKVINRIIYEKITDEPAPNEYTNYYMERGIQLEPEALESAELENMILIKNGGFFEYNGWIGASPDGIIDDFNGKNMLIQVKCPSYNTAIEYLKKKIIPKRYYYQMQHEMYASNYQYNMFFSYCHNLPSFQKIVERDENAIKEILDKIDEAISIVESDLEKI